VFPFEHSDPAILRDGSPLPLHLKMSDIIEESKRKSLTFRCQIADSGRSKMLHRIRVEKEILETESTYIRDLTELLESSSTPSPEYRRSAACSRAKPESSLCAFPRLVP
jgi:hypothetical protein